MKNVRKTFISATLGLALLVSPASKADVELPMGGINGCPFLHDDSYDLGPLLETLKTQIGAELNNRNSCKQAIQSIISNLSPLQDFYKTLDPSTKQKITKSVYANTLAALNSRKLALEMSSSTSTPEYSNVVSQISIIESSEIGNEIDLQSNEALQKQNLEAEYRNQLITYSSSLLNAYNSTARNSPNCIGKMGGAGQVLSAVLGGVSIATGLGVNPTAQLIGVAVSASAQLVSLLKDSKVRSAYNDLVKLKNYKTLACTYYSLKKASCEYKRAYRIAQDVGKLRDFVQNKFGQDINAEYERHFVNRGRIKLFADVFKIIAQMGSPLTLDQSVLFSYLAAKSVDFNSLGEPPQSGEDQMKAWLIRARAYGVNFPDSNPMNGSAATPAQQVQAAMADITAKKSTITAAEAIIARNLSFLDLRRKLSSDFPNIQNHVTEMKAYIAQLQSGQMIQGVDKGTLNAAQTLLTKLEAFLQVALDPTKGSDPNSEYENELISKGTIVFEELAKGSVAQLTKQSVLALAGKGSDRLTWAFNVIKNAYLNRDQVQRLPLNQRFAEFQKNRNILSDVIGNYQVFSGSGTTFRDEDFAKSVSTFEDAFKREMFQALEYAMETKGDDILLEGQTAAQLCALYYPSLQQLSGDVFGGKRAARLLYACRNEYKTLGLNKIISNSDFTINYDDECTYFAYSRELEIQNLLVQLMNAKNQN